MSFNEIHQPTIDRIKEILKSIKAESSPDNLVKYLTELVSYQSWVGTMMVETQMIYNRLRNKIRTEKNLSGTVATMKAESTSQFHDLLSVKQLYRDIQASRSDIKMALRVMRDEHYG